MRRLRPITLTIAALGGQGGGVVTDWLVMTARRAGYFVQATSVPGVAQRTGATIYYLEFFARGDAPAGREPVMALMPNPGDVDIVVASEWMEAGRAINRGLVTKDRTTLVASTHRDYTISEKMALGEGRASSRELFEIASATAAKLVGFDMLKTAEAADGRISAVILGGIAGAGVLPFGIEDYHHAIKESGVGVEASLRAFEAGRLAAAAAALTPLTAAAWPDNRGAIDASDYTLAALSAPLRARITGGFPVQLHELLGMAAARLSDYQDATYAGVFLDRMERIHRIDGAKPGDFALSAAAARALGLWMSFEDVMRVAQLKTRRGRLMRIRREVRAQPGDLVQIREFVKPRVEEICGTLPAGLGRRLLASARAHRALARLTAGRRISTSTISGFAMLRTLAALRRFRRGSLRFRIENQRIEAWLGQIAEVAPDDYGLAVELAECQTLVKGYGDTHERGWSSFSQISALAPALLGHPDSAALLRTLREAALADDGGVQLERAISALRSRAPAAA
ncbi:MAG TPA: indolepyruvate oxidoreductase subunit beta family protein [Steroidobacteraceae bacterium]|jgi:indolepyruvate ferredoxin oxidoreductase beta subunit|nr:indolepyruvate oxidoreductase subunit beta family protein [Steroidobacteraceae bacterium]